MSAVWIRTHLSTKGEQGADGKPPEADQPPNELTSITRLP